VSPNVIILLYSEPFEKRTRRAQFHYSYYSCCCWCCCCCGAHAADNKIFRTETQKPTNVRGLADTNNNSNNNNDNSVKSFRCRNRQAAVAVRAKNILLRPPPRPFAAVSPHITLSGREQHKIVKYSLTLLLFRSITIYVKNVSLFFSFF